MKTPDNDKLYFPPRLAKAMSAVIREPLTFVTAGSGFGKTTAVAATLEQLPRTTLYRWYTCFGEPPQRAWAGICRLIGFADPRVGDHLTKLELPTADHLGYISSLMEELSCPRETVLVIDNYQLSGFPAPYRLLDALAAHCCENLHLAVLSHPVYTDVALQPTHPRICYISQERFCFSPQDAQRLFALHRTELSAVDAERLCEITEGWVAALRLHLASYLSGNGLGESSGLNDLLEQAFWRCVSPREQKLFLGLSLLDSFTEAQAARLLGREVMPAPLWTAVRQNSFVRAVGREYTLHHLLKEFLATKWQTLLAVEQRRLWQRAGQACQLQGKNVEALLLFSKAGDDVAATSVPLSSPDLAELVRTQTELLTELLTRCRIELLSGRWLLLQDVAVKAGLNGKATLARTAVMRLIELKGLSGEDETQRRYAAAALELVASFRAYNDLTEMCHHHAAAVALLDDPQDFYLPNDSWTFSIPSVAYMFWREAGKLAIAQQQLADGIPTYALLSGGKGLGGPELMAAEALLLAGEEEESAALIYQGRAIAKANAQDSLLFCAQTLLGRLALLRGDASAFTAVIDELKRLAFVGQEFLCLTASEVATGFLYSLLGQKEDIPAWLLTEDGVRQTVYPVSVPFALIISLRRLAQKAPAEVIGTAEAYIKESTALHHALPPLYFLLTEAVCFEQGGDRKQALAKLEQALAWAVPDRVYLPIAEYYTELSAVLSDPALTGIDAETLARVCSLGRRFALGTAQVRAALYGASPLTPREREMALLAQSRLSTQEIAERLSVSAATVKNTLNKVYAKLGVSGKAELRQVRL